MTVSSQANNATFPGNGVTTSFPMPFRFFRDQDIFAFLINISTGSVAPLAIGVDYTLIGAGEPEVDGNAQSVIQMVTPPSVGTSLYVERVMEVIQETDIVNQGAFFAELHESVFDRLTMIVQQISGAINNALQLDKAGIVWDAKNRRIANVADPVSPQDAATMAWAQQFIGDILADYTGDINVAANVAYFGTDGVSIYNLQDLSNKIATDKGAALIGRSVVVVDSIKDLLNPALSGRTDILVHVQRYWAGVDAPAGGGDFVWLNNPKSNHDGGVRISPTVPWDGLQSSHGNFLNGVGETAPGGSGYWSRVVQANVRSPVFFGATTSSTVPDCNYILTKFESRFPGSEADLMTLSLRVTTYPSGAKYFNGSFTRISDSKVIEPGWANTVRVGNRNALVGRNTASNLTTNNHEQSAGNGYNLTALGDGALFSAGNTVKHQTAIGPNAGFSQQYGRYNIYIGLEAGYSCTGNAGDDDIGSRNVVVGDNGARFNQGDQNIAMGRNAMQVNTSGRQNVYIGSACGGGIGPVSLDGETIVNPFPTTGDLKTAVGTLALNWGYASFATACGSQALENLKGGVNCSAFGHRALQLLESNYSPKGTLISTAGAGAKTWTRSGTTVTVTDTAHTNTANNVAAISFTSNVPANVIGVTQYVTIATTATNSWTFTVSSAAAAAMGTSGSATLVEVYRNVVQTTQDNNTACGNLAGANLVSGSENAFFGQASAFSLTSGVQNTALGRSALRTLQSGAAATALNNCTGVGYDTRVSGDNQVQIGNSATTTYVYGTVQNRSDARDKTDVRDTELGLDFVLGLRAVSGRWDMRDDYVDVAEDGTVTRHEKDGSRARKRRHQWFIAQEVDALCKRLGVEFGGLQHHAVDGGDDVYSIGYDEFIPPVVKAVQDCWSRMDELEKRIRKLEAL